MCFAANIINKAVSFCSFFLSLKMRSAPGPPSIVGVFKTRPSIRITKIQKSHSTAEEMVKIRNKQCY